MVRLAAPTIDAMLRSLQQRGGGLGARSTPPIDVPHPVTYAPVFYPGTPVASEATALRVAAGEVREGIDFTVDLVPTATVEGRVVMSDGSDPPAVQLSLTAVGPVLPFSFMPFVSSGSARQDADGSFAYPNVTPGRYVLFARESPGRNATSNRPGALWAMAALDVAGADLGGVTLTLRPTLRFAGRVAFEGSALPPPKNLSTIRVGLVRIEGALAEGAASGAPAPGLPVPNFATVAADGTFVADGVLPGLYIVSALSPDLAGWQLRSAVVAGRDILDVPLDIGSADVDVSGAVLTFSDRQSQLSGVLQDTSGQPAPGHTVIVFPADRTLWHAARRLQAAQPASDGYFSFGGLPAGHYRLAAVNEMPTADWRRASFLEQAVAASIAVTIAEGATVSQDVSLR
jgi:hypothetical protein